MDAGFSDNCFFECELGIGTGKPFSHLVRGMNAGVLTTLFNVKMKVIETKCIAKGDPYCEFVLLLAGYSYAESVILDSRGNLRRKTVKHFGQKGSVYLPAAFSKNKQRFVGFDAVIEKLRFNFMDMRIDKEKFRKSVIEAIKKDIVRKVH